MQIRVSRGIGGSRDGGDGPTVEYKAWCFCAVIFGGRKNWGSPLFWGREIRVKTFFAPMRKMVRLFLGNLSLYFVDFLCGASI